MNHLAPYEEHKKPLIKCSAETAKGLHDLIASCEQEFGGITILVEGERVVADDLKRHLASIAAESVE